MKKIVVLISACCLLQAVTAQNPLVKQWDQHYGGTNADFLSAFEMTADSGFILAGYSFSGIGGDRTQNKRGQNDYWMIRIDQAGNKLWDARFGGIKPDFLTSLCITSDGGYLLGGYSNSNASGDKSQDDHDTSQTFNDYWILKTDSNGVKQWDRTLGGKEDDYLMSVLQTPDGGFLAGGFSDADSSFEKTGHTRGGKDFWVVKLDASGNVLWDKTYGGTLDDQLYTMVNTADGGFLLGGVSYSGIGGDKTSNNYGMSDYWIIKTDSAGNMQWDADFGGTNADLMTSLSPTSDGGYILGGHSLSVVSGTRTAASKGDYDFYIVKTDAAGIQQWDRAYGGTDAEELYRVRQTQDNGYLVSGTSYSPISGDKSEYNMGPEQTWVVKTDSTGALKWEKTLHTLSTLDDEMGLAVQTGPKDFMMANYTDGVIGGDKTVPNWDSSGFTYDFWVIRYTDTSTYYAPLPVVALSASDTTFCGKQCIDFFDLSTNAPVSWQWSFSGGTPSTSTDQNPTGICYNSYGSFDVTLVACNGAGCDTLVLPAFINVLQNPAVPVITGHDDTLFCTPAYAYQWYQNSTPVNGATSSYYVFQQQGSYYVVVSDSNGCETSSTVVGTGISETPGMTIALAPNPSPGSFRITGLKQGTSEIIVSDMSGRRIYSETVHQNAADIRLDTQPGWYMVSVITADAVRRMPVMISR